MTSNVLPIKAPAKNGYKKTDTQWEPAKMAPHSQEAEEGLLGSIFIGGNERYREVEFLKPDYFFILRNDMVFEAMGDIYKRGDAIDHITVADELSSRKMGQRTIWVKEGDQKVKKTVEWDRLQEVGGASRLIYLSMNIATSIHAETYARIIERVALRRKMLDAAADIAKLARDGDIDAYTAWDRGQKVYESVLPKGYRTAGIRPLAMGLSEFYDRVADLYEHKEKEPGIPTGFTDLDKMLGGLQNSDLIILGGRPSMGKTSLQINMAVNAIKAGKKAAFFSLEMSEAQLVNRIVSAEIGVNSMDLWRGKLTEDEFKRFVAALDTLQKWPLMIDPSPELSVAQIRTKCQHLKSMGQLDMVFVDYLNMAQVEGDKDSRHLQVAESVRGFKNLAKELNVPLVLAAQLNRNCEQRQDKRPVLSDLAETDQAGWGADMVMFIYRDEKYNPNTEYPNTAEIIVAKNRNGATGTASLYFNRQLTKFSNLKRTEVNLG